MTKLIRNTGIAYVKAVTNAKEDGKLVIGGLFL
jgi:hypothetical protein